MSDKLTLRPPGLESKFSTPSDSAEDESAPERIDFLSGVRRGIKKLGSISGPHHRPANIQVVERFSPALSPAATTPEISPASAGSDSTQYRRPKRHAPSASDSILEKPLPKTPSALPVEELLQTTSALNSPFTPAPPDTPKPVVLMSRQAMSGSRTSTMDSATSGPGQSQMYASGFKPPSSAYLSDMSGKSSYLEYTIFSQTCTFPSTRSKRSH